MASSERRQGIRTAAALLALTAVALPAGATSPTPQGALRTGPPAAIVVGSRVAVLPEPQALAVSTLPRAQARVLRMSMAGAEDRGRLVRLEQLTRKRIMLPELTALAREQAALAEDLRHRIAAVVWDRDLDRTAGDPGWTTLWRDADFDHPQQPCETGPWDAAIDALVSAARFPARAGLVAEHLIVAFAKITPRLARALFF